MAFNLPSGKRVPLGVVWKDKNGNPATVDGPTTFEVSAGAEQGAIEVDINSGASFLRGNLLGDGQVTATADADLGDGVKSVQAVGSFTTVPGEAAVGELSFGEPQD